MTIAATIDDVLLFIRDSAAIPDLIQIGQEVAKALTLSGRDATFDVEVEAVEAAADAAEEAKLAPK